MLTSSQKRELKSMANRLNAVFQVGKDGVNGNMIIDIFYIFIQNIYTQRRNDDQIIKKMSKTPCFYFLLML